LLSFGIAVVYVGGLDDRGLRLWISLECVTEGFGEWVHVFEICAGFVA
jgi:hypothetical protein